MRHDLLHQKYSGFSLIELSVIISVAATLAVGFLVWTSPPGITNATKNVETHRKMQYIANALEAFRVHEGRLPCPADPLMREDNTRLPDAPTDTYVNAFGVEDLNRSNSTGSPIGIDCPNPVGAIPFHTLGLSSSYLYDAWNRKFEYHISDNLCGTSTVTVETGSTTHLQKGCSSNDYLNNSGNLIIQRADGDPITDVAAYVVVSFGENGHGARMPSSELIENSTNTSEIENYNGNNIYVSDDLTTNFDDLVLYRTKSQIEQLANKKDALLFSKEKCRNNSTAIEGLSTTNLQDLHTNFTTYQQDEINSGDQVTLGILSSIQEICIEYYGADSDGITAWGGPKCPGSAQYSTASRACECPAGNWDNCCPGGNWDACLDQ
jgi:type II secretory pathway pseudopilin PulG